MNKIWASLAIFAYFIMGLAAATTATIFVVLGVGFHALVSNSMAPHHPVGSVVVTIQTPTPELIVGDVVKLPLPDKSGHHYVHRVVGIDRTSEVTSYVTKGDNNKRADPWALQILSPTTPRVIATVPLVGHLNTITSPRTSQLVLSSAVGVFAVIAINRAFGIIRKRPKGAHADLPNS
jgi:signal peptidase I